MVCYVIGAGETPSDPPRPGAGDLVIAADAGLTHAHALGMTPALTVGDFDSLGHLPEGGDVATLRAQAATSEHYLLSANGIAETGEIINIDGAGNRVASAIYGHKKVWIVVGKNKLAPTYDEALWRARNIAAPKNAQRLHAKTPCAVKADHCYDCKSPGRICRALTVLWGAMMGSDMEVVLVNEDLGY